MTEYKIGDIVYIKIVTRLYTRVYKGECCKITPKFYLFKTDFRTYECHKEKDPKGFDFTTQEEYDAYRRRDILGNKLSKLDVTLNDVLNHMYDGISEDVYQQAVTAADAFKAALEKLG